MPCSTYDTITCFAQMCKWTADQMDGTLEREAGGKNGLLAPLIAAQCNPVVESRDLAIGQGSTLERATRTGFFSLR